MTPQLQQAIRLLALSNLEIESFIAEEIEKKPAARERRRGRAREPPARERDAGRRDEPRRGRRALPEVDAAAATAALDIDQDGEDLHQDSAADAMRGLQSGGLGLDGHRRRRRRRGEGPDFDAFAGEQRLAPRASPPPGRRARCRAPTCSSPTRSSSRSRRPAISSRRSLDLARRLGVAARRRRARARHHPDLRSGRASPRAPSPNASRCRPRTPIATIPPWRG